MNRHGHTPDAITPAPRTLHATVAQEWEWLRATDPAVLAQDIRAVTGHVDPFAQGVVEEVPPFAAGVTGTP